MMTKKAEKRWNFTWECALTFSWRFLDLVTDVRSPNWSALVGAFIGWWRNTFSVFHFFVWICCSNQSLFSFIFRDAKLEDRKMRTEGWGTHSRYMAGFKSAPGITRIWPKERDRMAIQPTSRTMVGSVLWEAYCRHQEAFEAHDRALNRGIWGVENALVGSWGHPNSRPLVKRDDLDDSVLTPSNLLIACSYYAGDLLLLSLNTP